MTKSTLSEDRPTPSERKTRSGRPFSEAPALVSPEEAQSALQTQDGDSVCFAWIGQGNHPDSFFTANGIGSATVAFKTGRVLLAKSLLSHGANPNLRKNPSYFSMALEHPSDHIAETLGKSLLEHGFDPRRPDGTDSQTPLHLACQRGFFILAQKLIGLEVSVDARNALSQTPLLCAILCSYSDAPPDERLIRLLLAHGANPLALDSQNQSPLSLARSFADDHQAHAGWGSIARALEANSEKSASS